MGSAWGANHPGLEISIPHWNSGCVRMGDAWGAKHPGLEISISLVCLVFFSKIPLEMIGFIF